MNQDAAEESHTKAYTACFFNYRMIYGSLRDLQQEGKFKKMIQYRMVYEDQLKNGNFSNFWQQGSKDGR